MREISPAQIAAEPRRYSPAAARAVAAVPDATPSPRAPCTTWATRAGRPIDLVVTFSRHHCPHCDCYFPADISDLALPKCQYTRRVQDLAVRLVAEDGLPYQAASWHLWRDHRVFVPCATIQNWVEAAGEKKDRQHQDHLPRRGAG